MKEFSPLEAFEYALRRWWLVALLVIAGGGAGGLFHRVQPPLYEAKATFMVSIDFSRSDALTRWDQDRYEEDHTILAAMALIVSTPVIEQVSADVQARGIPAEALVFNRRVFIERKQALMTLRVRNENPETAALIANLWADRAYAALLDAQQHALQAWTLRNLISGLTACLPAPQPVADPASLCASASLDELQQRVQAAEVELNAETIASKGIIPALTFDLSQRASLPDAPAAYNTSLLVIAGALVGFVVGAALATGRTSKS